LFCLVWALYLGVRWWEEGRLWQMSVLGSVLGRIPAVRYADAIMGGAFLVFALCGVRRYPKIYRHYLAAVLGAAVPLTLLLIHNQLVMGAFWKTGYALTNEQTGFSWAYFKEHAVDYVRTANAGGLGLVYALGVVGLVLMVCTRKAWRVGLLLALTVVPMFLVYMAYYWGPQNNPAMTMRFLVPVFPPLVLAAVWVLAELTAGLNVAGRIAVPVVLLGLQLLWGGSDILTGAEQTHYEKQSLAVVTDGLQQAAAPGDVVVASGNLLQHLDYVRLWKVADLSLMRGQGGMGGGGGGGRFGNADPLAPSPMQAQKAEVRRELYPTNTIERENKYVEDLQKWAGSQRIFFVGTEDEMRQLLSDKGPGEEMQIVRRVALPEAPVLPARTSGFGGMRQGRGGAGGGPIAAGPNGPAANGRPNARRAAGGFAGPGGGPPPGGMGGMGGMRGGFGDAREVVIAQWTFHGAAK
jgi:hypothetical protein